MNDMTPRQILDALDEGLADAAILAKYRTLGKISDLKVSSIVAKTVATGDILRKIREASYRRRYLRGEVTALKISVIVRIIELRLQDCVIRLSVFAIKIGRVLAARESNGHD